MAPHRRRDQGVQTYICCLVLVARLQVHAQQITKVLNHPKSPAGSVCPDLVGTKGAFSARGYRYSCLPSGSDAYKVPVHLGLDHASASETRKPCEHAHGSRCARQTCVLAWHTRTRARQCHLPYFLLNVCRYRRSTRHIGACVKNFGSAAAANQAVPRLP